jgi:hypothetical protein
MQLAEAIGRHAATERSTEPQGSTPLTMGGFGERQREAANEALAGRKKKSFFNAEETVR